MGDLPALEARAQGFATRLLAISSVSGSTWIIAKKGGPTTLSGLAGGSLGSPPGTAPYRYAYELLEERGLLSKVTISPLQTPNGVAALESGQIDAFSAPQPYAAELAAEGYPVLDKESSHPNLLATGEIVTTQTFLDAHRKFVPSFDRTYTSIVANIDAHAAGFYSYEAFVEGLPLAVAKQAYPVSAYPATPLIASGITLLGSTLKFALSLKLVTNTFDLKAWPVSPK
jgi:NitT/TauT family transport system substrate-binding protein/sulfonate transport system substrate-binding protein